MASHQRDRAVAFGLQLSQAHRELRNRITRLKADLGRRRSADSVLVTHCLAFCAALTSHHEGEDKGMFDQLLKERPDLERTVANLMEDHQLIEGILRRVAALADRAAESGDLEAVRRELDGLTAIMDSHFAYEERTISAALDAGITDTGWSERVFQLGEG
ncbi:hypothetical protein Val02_32440 [Virgisporangium aliadipatigenens]|uniref:Hemerythrin-like domain-containing protein n=1 Tax=Virgisporangium aliadipatigenens TaxID=741659 RepID=A0A8J3YMB3_9ACTN|nr:hemerythrin domain-containing protein [Virgisporangium aliadipatigenens]GIJ46358.1 hypothetical protein Val02_32440 [Virgisporangium aliadipatigenens]